MKMTVSMRRGLVLFCAALLTFLLLSDYLEPIWVGMEHAHAIYVLGTTLTIIVTLVWALFAGTQWFERHSHGFGICSTLKDDITFSFFGIVKDSVALYIDILWIQFSFSKDFDGQIHSVSFEITW